MSSFIWNVGPHPGSPKTFFENLF